MASKDERLALLVRFLAADLKRLTPPGWQKLQQDIRSFLAANPGRIQEKGATGWGIIARPPSKPQPDLTEQELKDMQEEARAFINFALRGEHGVKATTPVAITGLYQLWLPGRGGFLRVEGSTREMFLLVLHLLMIRGADEHLRFCPECGKVFLRVGKQIFCGYQCKKRANMRDWRKTQTGKAARARSTRKRYERQIRAKPGLRGSTPALRPRRREA